jgi:adenine deaminase
MHAAELGPAAHAHGRERRVRGAYPDAQDRFGRFVIPRQGGGIMIDRELELHSEAGIPVWDVLRTATSGTADIMKMGNRIGRIKEGYEADLAIFEADPVADVRATAQVYGVLNNGKFLRATELMGGVQ